MKGLVKQKVGKTVYQWANLAIFLFYLSFLYSAPFCLVDHLNLGVWFFTTFLLIIFKHNNYCIICCARTHTNTVFLRFFSFPLLSCTTMALEWKRTSKWHLVSMRYCMCVCHNHCQPSLCLLNDPKDWLKIVYSFNLLAYPREPESMSFGDM